MSVLQVAACSSAGSTSPRSSRSPSSARSRVKPGQIPLPAGCGRSMWCGPRRNTSDGGDVVGSPQDHLGDIDLAEIYAFGNMWIELGNTVFTNAHVNPDSSIQLLGLGGAAGAEALHAWAVQSRQALKAAHTAWSVGHAIHKYADSLKEEAEKLAAEDATAIVNVLLELFASIALVLLAPISAPLLTALSQVLNRLVSILVEVLESVTSFASTIGNIARFGAAAAFGGATTLGMDVGLQKAAEELTGGELGHDWGLEGLNVILGALGGGLLVPQLKIPVEIVPVKAPEPGSAGPGASARPPGSDSPRVG